MNHIQMRAMERLGESLDLSEIKRLTKSIIDGECKKYLMLGKDIGIYQVFLNQRTEAIAIFDHAYRIIKTIGRSSWIKRKGNRFYYTHKRQKEDIESQNNNYKRDKVYYDRTKHKQKTRELLRGDEEFFTKNGRRNLSRRRRG